MKVAQVIASCGSGGAERQALEAMRSFAGRIDQELWVLAASDPDVDPGDLVDFERAFVASLAACGIPVRFVGKRAGRDRWRTLRTLRRWHDAFRPDVVHAHLEEVAFHTVTALVGRSTPVVQSIHSMPIRHPHVQRWWIAARSAALLAATDDIEDEIRRCRLVQPVHRVCYGIDAARVRCRIRSGLVRRWICFGSLTPHKRHDLLLQAFRRCLDESVAPAPVLRVIGGGPCLDALRARVVDLDLARYVEVLGRVSDDDLPAHVDWADAFVMQSDYEGLPIALIEAATAGLPIVATDVGSNHEIVQHGLNGLRVPPGSVDALASALVDVGKRHDVSDWSRASAAIGARFTTTEAATQLLQTYRTVAS